MALHKAVSHHLPLTLKDAGAFLYSAFNLCGGGA